MNERILAVNEFLPMMEEIRKYYGNQFEPRLLDEIGQVGTIRNITEGTTLIEFGQYIQSLPLLLSGVVKVLREDQDGNELLLYFLERGDTCAMTLTCCMGQTKSEIRAIAETETTLVMVPIRKMGDWTRTFRTWREFVFESYHNRLMEVLDTIDSIAFLNMDERLLKYLRDKEKVMGQSVIHKTHQEIADQLNTSRVVVSRLLKKLEQLGTIELGRNSIKLLEG